MYVRCWAWVELENPIASCWDWRFFVAENESNLHCIQIWLVCSPSHISASGLMLGWPKWTNDVSIYISISTKGYHQTTLYQKSIICPKKYRSKYGFLPKMLTFGFEFLPDYAHIGIWTHHFFFQKCSYWDLNPHLFSEKCSNWELNPQLFFPENAHIGMSKKPPNKSGLCIIKTFRVTYFLQIRVSWILQIQSKFCQILLFIQKLKLYHSVWWWPGYSLWKYQHTYDFCKDF